MFILGVAILLLLSSIGGEHFYTTMLLGLLLLAVTWWALSHKLFQHVKVFRDGIVAIEVENFWSFIEGLYEVIWKKNESLASLRRLLLFTFPRLVEDSGSFSATFLL
jgi:hypothetical protein